jgi:pantoate--beta-alanine ligase
MKNLSISFMRSGMRIGFVPTMGALHEGHLSLLKKAREMSDVLVMSIFLNPTQFTANEDLSKYPKPFDIDSEKARREGCDVLFAPQADEIYPPGFRTSVQVEGLGSELCGISRPSHFQGVTTVVLKLFNIVMPQCAVFGGKDAQQAIILKRMVRDLNMSIQLVVAPTVRETDGLAMSSRNTYLTPEERIQAPKIYCGLLNAGKLYEKGERAACVLKKTILECLEKAPLISPEYIEIVDTVNLKAVEILADVTLVAVAGRTSQSKTRLIDNVVLGGNI